jgi:tricorn protease
VGLLGVDFDVDKGGLQITRIYEGAAWDSDARSPLRTASGKVSEGDYLLAVNGIDVDPTIDPWSYFVNTAGKVTRLTVSTKPGRDDEARDVLVTPLRSDRDLRYRHWIEQNRRHVDEETDGKVGYIYVPDTSVNGQNNLFRQFYGQRHCEALIIDERWNGGGQIPTRFVELLNRPITNYWAVRDGATKRFPWPYDAHPGPKCMLINGLAGSGGDAFPAYFRGAGLGKLIGERTWGGLVGIGGGPRLMDGAYVRVPSFAYFDADGTWGIEGHGVDPDIEVVADPAQLARGIDPQLERAIAEMLEEIRTNPWVAPAVPDYPDRSGMGIEEEDK